MPALYSCKLGPLQTLCNFWWQIPALPFFHLDVRKSQMDGDVYRKLFGIPSKK
jgi:hypothetical protein